MYHRAFSYVHYSTDSSIDSTSGTFTDEVQSVCHRITVSENSVTEQNGMIVVGIRNSSLEPSNTQLSISEADVNVFDSDSKLGVKIWPCV